jgi:hypothetical protein
MILGQLCGLWINSVKIHSHSLFLQYYSFNTNSWHSRAFSDNKSILKEAYNKNLMKRDMRSNFLFLNSTESKMSPDMWSQKTRYSASERCALKFERVFILLLFPKYTEIKTKSHKYKKPVYFILMPRGSVIFIFNLLVPELFFF